MEGRNEHLLINYFDRTLEEKEMREMEALINTNLEVRNQWQYLKLAVEAVEYAALYDQVATVRENFRTIQPVEVLQASYKKSIRIHLRPFLQFAAGLLLFVIGFGGYKYFTVNATTLYHEAFIPYTLPTTRGLATITEIEKAYQLQQWNAVIANIQTTSVTDNKTLFLAGMAHLQLHQTSEASVLFRQVMVNNTQTNDDLYQDDAQFYWAISNLEGANKKDAIILLQQIQTDKKHVYQQQANRIGSLDLKILSMRNDR